MLNAVNDLAEDKTGPFTHSTSLPLCLTFLHSFHFSDYSNTNLNTIISHSSKLNLNSADINTNTTSTTTASEEVTGRDHLDNNCQFLQQRFLSILPLNQLLKHVEPIPPHC